MPVGFLKKSFAEKRLVFSLYILCIALLYPQVVFFGRTLIPALYYPSVFSPPGYVGIRPVNTFNIDLGTPAFFEFPINKLIGDSYKKGKFPLWNPYQGCGTPLLAQYSTRALFPYQILEDISPWWLWDYFILGRLLVAGFFTFLFLRLLKMSFMSSFLGGLFYMFSGSFTWFINLEQFTNVAMTIPIFLYCLERLHQFRSLREVGISALSLFLVLTAGQPEIAVFVCLLGFLYYLFRAGLSLKEYPRFILMVVAGTTLSLPIILPFIEFARYSFTPHPFVSKEPYLISMEDFTQLWEAISLFVPTIFQTPRDWNTIPMNGAWDYLGGYPLLSCLYFVLLGLFIKVKERRLLVFFFAFGLGLVLKNFGVWPFKLLGYLPLFHQSWSQRWAGSVWVFCICIAGAVGFEVIVRFGWNKKLLFFVLIAMLLAVSSLFWYSGLIREWKTLSALLRQYYIPSAFLGLLIALLLLVAIFYFLAAYKDKLMLFAAMLILIMAEAFFYIPKGCDVWTKYLYLEVFLVAFFASLFMFWNKKKLAFIFLGAFILSHVFFDLFSPYGFSKRQDLFARRPFVNFLKEHLGQSRVMATETILFPNFAGVFGLPDIRFVNSMSLTWYQRYAELYLLGFSHDAWYAQRLWFTGIRIARVPERRVIYEALLQRQRFYSLLGVRFIVTPIDVFFDLPSFSSVYSDKEVRIYENLAVLPRVFVAHDITYARDYEKAQDMLTNINPLATVVLEEKPGIELAGGASLGSLASILSYTEDRVVIGTQLKRPGVLVLTDIFYPGWRAWVDGRESKVLRAYGLFRGIALKEGKHTVVFRYLPSSFKIGVFLAAAMLLLSLIFISRANRIRL